MFGLKPKVIFTVLFVAVLGFVAYQYVPAYVTDFQFRDFVRQEVKFASSAERTPEDVRRIVVDQARELGIDLNQKDVRITRRGTVLFTIELEYEWPINLRVHKHTLKFRISENGDLYERVRR
jgi:hypothetical protein